MVIVVILIFFSVILAYFNLQKEKLWTDSG